MSTLIKIKSLGKDSVIYGLSSVLTKMITVFLIPVYTRIFTPSDYGVMNIITNVLSACALFAVFGLDSAAARWYYDSDDLADRKSTLSSWFYFQTIVSTVFVVLMLVSTPLVFKYLLKDSDQGNYLPWIIASLTLWTMILPKVINSLFRFRRKPKQAVIFSLSHSILTIGVTILTVVYMRTGIVGVFIGRLCAGIAFSVVGYFILKDWLSFSNFNKVRLKKMLKFSAPLVPSSLAFWVLNSANSFFLLYYFGKAEVGLYAVGVSIGAFLMLFTTAFQQAWGPFAFSIIKDKDAKDVYASVFGIYAILASILLLFSVLFIPEILVLLTTPKFYSASWVATLMSINVIVASFSYIANLGLNIVKTNKPYARAVFMAAGLNLVLNFVIVPHLGMLGSALSVVISQSIVPVYLFYKSQQVYFVNYNFKKALFYILIALLIGILFRLLVNIDLGFIHKLILKTSIFITFLSIVYFVNRKHLNLSHLFKKNS